MPVVEHQLVTSDNSILLERRLDIACLERPPGGLFLSRFCYNHLYWPWFYRWCRRGRHLANQKRKEATQENVPPRNGKSILLKDHKTCRRVDGEIRVDNVRFDRQAGSQVDFARKPPRASNRVRHGGVHHGGDDLSSGYLLIKNLAHTSCIFYIFILLARVKRHGKCKRSYW